MSRKICLLLVLFLVCFVQATTLRQIRLKVYRLLDTDSTNRVLDSNFVDASINDVVPTIGADARCVVSEKKIKLQKYVHEYLIDSSMIKDGVIDVYIREYEAAKLNKVMGLIRRDTKEFGRTGTETPKDYDISGYNILLSVIPAVADTLDTLVIKYAVRPTALTAHGTVTNIPDDYVLALVYKACAHIYMSRGVEMSAQADQFEGHYNLELAKKRQLNSPDTLQSVVP